MREIKDLQEIYSEMSKVQKELLGNQTYTMEQLSYMSEEMLASVRSTMKMVDLSKKSGDIQISILLSLDKRIEDLSRRLDDLERADKRMEQRVSELEKEDMVTAVPAIAAKKK